MNYDNPLEIDDERHGVLDSRRESNLHYEAKLEVQALLRHEVCYSTYVEYILPLCRKHQGRDFSWHKESRHFGVDQFYDVNCDLVPTRAAAIEHRYHPLFVFDIVCESDHGLWAVFEITCLNPTEPRKRDYLQTHGIPLYEIDAARLKPKYQDDDGYKVRDYSDVHRSSLPLLGGDEVLLSDLITRAHSDGVYSGGRYGK